ncbi:MAG: ABC transporter permease subunit [Thermoflexales bacterium]|nr:ABC transporter permease subunit [Thermoflexales bacterium]MDW8350544.1 ABC transporter permease subunit [Anaerolineae bacterium]
MIHLTDAPRVHQQAARLSQTGRQRGFLWSLRHNKLFLLMASPGVLLLLVFSYLPMIGIIIAFKDFRANLGIFDSPWVGFKNFEFLFRSPVLARITINTLLLNGLFIVTGLVASVGLALLLNEVRLKIAARAYQTVVFFPYFVSWVIVGYFSFALLNSDNGLVNQVLQRIGLSPVAWYSSPQYWPWILTLAYLWKSTGYGSVIYLAAMLGINQEYYEAAMLDGANKWQQIRYITLPHLVPVMTVLTLLAVGRIFFADFGLFYYVTRDNSLLYATTDVIDTYVYRALRVNADIGMAAAAGLYQSVVGFVLILASNWMVKKIDPDRALF